MLPELGFVTQRRNPASVCHAPSPRGVARQPRRNAPDPHHRADVCLRRRHLRRSANAPPWPAMPGATDAPGERTTPGCACHPHANRRDSRAALSLRENCHARPAAQRRSRRTARVLGGLHRPLVEPHVARIPGRDERHLARVEAGLRRAIGGPRARRRHLRDGGGGAAIRRRCENADHPQRFLQLPLDADPGDGCHRRGLHGAEGTPHGQRTAVTVRAGADRRGRRHDSPRAARGGLRATRRDRLRHDPAGYLRARRGRCRA